MICYFLFAACMQNDETLAPRNPQNDALTDAESAKAGSGTAREKGNFTAHLSGGNEVPANDMPGQGQVIFHVSKDGTEMSYKLIVANP